MTYMTYILFLLDYKIKIKYFLYQYHKYKSNTLSNDIGIFA